MMPPYSSSGAPGARLSRRELLRRASNGVGTLALGSLLSQSSPSPLAAAVRGTESGLLATPHIPAKARSVLFLFMEGAVSQVDSFDHKPMLEKYHGQDAHKAMGRIEKTQFDSIGTILKSPWQFRQHGQSGLWLSDWLPYTAQCADDLAVIRSCKADGINHSAGVCQMNTGSILGGRPSLGSWVSYGLGTENNDLPSFVVMQDS